MSLLAPLGPTMQGENHGRLLGDAVYQLIAEPNFHNHPRCLQSPSLSVAHFTWTP